MSKPAGNASFQAPKGTRDLYPEDLLRRRYLTQVWRDTAIRHGFDEIDGPTFEEARLYSVKSGDGILGELFQAFSGKSPDEVERVRETGMAPFALRPEFTPTLARLYAARARQLPQPTKWFSIGPYFRAERPQRGRLREFLQWNMDVIGGPEPDLDSEEPQSESNRAKRARLVQSDVDCVEACIASLEAFGLSSRSVQLALSDRHLAAAHLVAAGLSAGSIDEGLAMLDRVAKLPREVAVEQARALGFDLNKYVRAATLSQGLFSSGKDWAAIDTSQGKVVANYLRIKSIGEVLGATGRLDWCQLQLSVVRGLAYYTGTVFEAIADGERAVAGGGRYDGLVELLGGPRTPAVGFAMGDVVVSLLLEDKGLLPKGAELMDAVSRAPASVRPEAFVVSADERLGDPHVAALVARLRRGVECQAWLEREDRKPWACDRYALRPMHARQTYKSTTNLKKLLADAEKQHARFAVVVHDEHKVQLKDLDRREELTHPTRGDFSADPASEAYVGRAIVDALDGR
ncbi:MAG: ATP phosphoribosyltransferase regulatory subunit [Planctomycetota bacterium]